MMSKCPSLMTGYRLTVLAGDGTGPEVIAEALRVIDVFQQNSPISFEITEIPCGGQYYLETGEEWPEGSFEHCRDNSDAILLGAIGWPDARLPNGDMRAAKSYLDLGADSNYMLMSVQSNSILACNTRYTEYTNRSGNQIWLIW